MKKFSRIFSLALAAVATVCGFSAFAAGEDAIDVTAATGAITQMQTAVTSYWTAAQPVVLSVLGIALVASLIWLGFKLINKGSKKIG